MVQLGLNCLNYDALHGIGCLTAAYDVYHLVFPSHVQATRVQVDVQSPQSVLVTGSADVLSPAFRHSL